MKSYAQDEAPEGMIDFASSRKYSLFSEGLPLPNSPEAYSMIQYSSPQANLYRGEVSIDIPFYTYSDSDFEIPISFSYRSGGHKPNVPYGVMGLGWSLNAGGFISRDENNNINEYQMSYIPFESEFPEFIDADFSQVNGLTTGESGFIGKTLFPDNNGSQNSITNSIQIIINSELSPLGAAETFSHEGYGHILLYLMNNHNGASHSFIQTTGWGQLI